MARLSGMTSDAFPSPSAGLGSILRDQKALTGATSNRSQVLLGISHPRATPSVSMASSPVDSFLFEADASGDEPDDFTEEDVWASETRSWKHDSLKHPALEESEQDLSKMSFPDAGLGLGLGHRKQGMNNAEKLSLGNCPKQRVNGSIDELGLGISNKQSVEIVLSSSRHRENGMGIANTFLNSSAGAVGLMPITRVSESSSKMSSNLSTATWMIPQRSRVGKNSSRRHAERQSAPVQVPDWSKIKAKPKCTRMGVMDDNSDDDKDEDDERLPPHELVAREYARSQRTTFSVCEGQGRTLKGRDLSRVRNAVWSQMGFAD